MLPNARMFLHTTANPLSELETICKTLANVIESNFGPKSQVTLMSSSTGHVSLSSDGFTILSSLHMSHPLARSIIQSLNRFHLYHGDGCKSIVLYLSALANALQVETNNCSQFSPQDNDTFIRGLHSRSLTLFLNHHMPIIIEEMTRNLDKIWKKDDGLLINDVILKVAKAVLGAALPSNSDSQLANVVTDYLTQGCSTLNDISDLCLRFDDSVRLIPHALYSSSCVKTGVCLSSSLHNATILSGEVSVSFICMQCPMGGAAAFSRDSDIVQLTSSSSDLIGANYSVLNLFLSSVKGRGISLIMSALKVSDICLQLCQAWSIAVIDCVDDEDLQRICAILRKSPITSVTDVIEEKNIMQALSCEKIQKGQKCFININLSGESSQPKTIFLAGPSDGICQQLKIRVKKCMTVVNRLLDSVASRSEKVHPLPTRLLSNIIPGGGCFEAVFIDSLHKYSEQLTNHQIKLCCSIVQKMLLSIPRTLSRQGFPISSHVLDVGFFVDSTCYGKGTDRIVECDILEVLSVKVASVYSALSLMISLLRINKIIGVTRLKPPPEEDDEYDIG